MTWTNLFEELEGRVLCDEQITLGDEIIDLLSAASKGVLALLTIDPDH